MLPKVRLKRTMKVLNIFFRGNQGEAQLHLKSDNISEFDHSSVSSDELQTKIVEAFKRQQTKAIF
jgi:hypothetical protein